MARYIELDALVDKIEKTINKPYPKHDQQCDWEDGYCGGLYKALSIIEDTLEVKEVDFENEFNNFLDNIEGVPRMWHSDEQIEWGKDIAKHFFELGLKAQKGE